jgi:ADP-ribose pyrophosphatase
MMQPSHRLDRQDVFRGRVFDVQVDRVRLPHGPVATQEIVRHARSVVLLPMPDRRRIILVRQYRYAVDRWLWELPAGSVSPRESAESAARRECREEVGLEAGRIERLGSFYASPGYCDETMVFYLLEDLAPVTSPVAADEDEHVEPRAYSLEDARAMVRAGEIVDMKTALGLTLV